MGIDAVNVPTYDGDPVVIVGNGPVGQSLALLLARWGIRSVVLDRRPRRDLVGSKAICQHGDVLDIWDSIGAGRAIADEGTTWERARTFYRDRELFCLELPGRGRSTFPPFVNISQCRTEELLDEQVTATGLVEVRWSHEVTGVRDTADGAEVEVSTPEGASTLRAPYVVLCSGGHSERLRAHLGVEFGGRSFDDHFLICDIRAELPGWEQERRFYFDPAWNPGRQVLIHPCPDSTYRIDWQVPAEFDLAAEERTGALEQRIRLIVGDADYEVLWRTVYRFHSRCADRMLVGHVLLAGDAAHLMAPFGARGLNSGVGDADNAAWKLAFVLRGWAPHRLLDSYDAERVAAARENLAVTTATMDFLVPQSEAAWAHRRQTLERAVDDPAVLPLVDSGRLFEPFWYVDSPLTTPDATREPASRPPRGQVPAPGAGVLLPDLPVRDPDSGAPTRLRTLCRHGLTVLVAEGGPVPITGWADGAPVRVHEMSALVADTGAPDEVVATLGARAGEAWVVRPDAFVAAVVDTANPIAVQAAVGRATGRA